MIRQRRKIMREMDEQIKILHKALGICAKEHDKEPTDYVSLAMRDFCCCECGKFLYELPKTDSKGNKYCRKHYEERCGINK